LVETKDSVVHLQSGRILEIQEGGDLYGLPVFSFHGNPGCRQLFPAHVEDAKKQGIHLIGYSRPGYGRSTRLAGRSKVDAVAEVIAIADKLGIDRFGVWGHSEGGNYALACAAMLPSRVVAASSLSTVAPYGAAGLDWFSGMGELNVEDFKLMMRNQHEWEEKNRKDSEIMKRAGKEELVGFLGSLVSDVDRDVLTTEFVNLFRAQVQEAFRLGIYGPIDDSLADAKPWGFDVSSIKVPTQVWHGRHDRFVGFVHGEWLAKHVPNADTHLEEEEGHLTMYIQRIHDVHSWLADKF
jgi:pimeloyl-ACP methyl ester carboxylesterase